MEWPLFRADPEEEKNIQWIYLTGLVGWLVKKHGAKRCYNSYNDFPSSQKCPTCKAETGDAFALYHINMKILELEKP